uniref:Uncharacterized protein n=1 Tax=Parastrongyloides trichosuri TaxID=131310 RepID=A0A0N4Z0P7_PARTI
MPIAHRWSPNVETTKKPNIITSTSANPIVSTDGNSIKGSSTSEPTKSVKLITTKAKIALVIIAILGLIVIIAAFTILWKKCCAKNSKERIKMVKSNDKKRARATKKYLKKHKSLKIKVDKDGKKIDSKLKVKDKDKIKTKEKKSYLNNIKTAQPLNVKFGDGSKKSVEKKVEPIKQSISIREKGIITDIQKDGSIVNKSIEVKSKGRKKSYRLPTIGEDKEEVRPNKFDIEKLKKQPSCNLIKTTKKVSIYTLNGANSSWTQDEEKFKNFSFQISESSSEYSK